MFRVDGPPAVAAGRFRFMEPFAACDGPGAGRPIRQLIGVALPIEGAVTYVPIPNTRTIVLRTGIDGLRAFGA